MTNGDEPPGQAHDDWDPRDPAVLADQRQAHGKPRERCPVAHSRSVHPSDGLAESTIGLS